MDAICDRSIVWSAVMACAMLVCPHVRAGANEPAFTVADDTANISFVHTLNSNDRFGRQFGAGASAVDFDNDGDIDIYLPQAYGFPNELHMNNGDATFTEIGAAAGVDSLKESRAAIWLDYDGDGWLDLFVANDADAPEGQVTPDVNTVRNLLYRNQGDRTFVEVASSVGVALLPLPETTQTIGGLAAADIDNDNDVDLYVSCWDNANALYVNNGGSGFTESSLSAGVLEPGTSWAPMFMDADRDGWQDLLLNIDFGPNRLYRNLHTGTFTNIATQVGFATSFNEMGMSLGDVDNDGDVDTVATNIEIPYADPDNLDKYTVLMENHIDAGTLSFSENAVSFGMARTGWGWGCTLFDCNNDGWLDLGVTNGFNTSGPYSTDPSRFFLNVGGGQFVEMSTSVGFAGTLQGRGLIALDYDDDGDLDLYETNFGEKGHLFRNDTTITGHYLKLRIGQSGKNRFAVGAEVTVTAGGQSQTRVVSAGSSFLSQEPHELFFGLGVSTSASNVAVRWPGGVTDVYGPIEGDRRARIIRGIGVVAPADVNGDANINDGDLAIIASCSNGPITGLMSPGCAFADIDQDRDVDLADYAEMTRAIP